MWCYFVKCANNFPQFSISSHGLCVTMIDHSRSDTIASICILLYKCTRWSGGPYCGIDVLFQRQQRLGCRLQYPPRNDASGQSVLRTLCLLQLSTGHSSIRTSDNETTVFASFTFIYNIQCVPNHQDTANERICPAGDSKSAYLAADDSCYSYSSSAVSTAFVKRFASCLWELTLIWSSRDVVYMIIIFHIEQ